MNPAYRRGRPRSLPVLLAVVASALAWAAARPAASLEVSLEENRAERGNIGYVDLQKVFHRFPETQRAKQSYGEIVRQAEEQVNLRKAEIQALRAELNKLRMERDLLSKTPIPALELQRGDFPSDPPDKSGGGRLPDSSLPETTTPQTAVPAPEEPALAGIGSEPLTPGPASQLPPSVAGSTVAVSTKPAAPDFTNLPGMSSAARAEAGKTEPLVINIPGVTEEPIIVEPPAAASAPAGEALAPPPPAVSTASASAAAPDPRAAALAAREQWQRQVAGRDERLRELDTAIAAKELELTRKEDAFRSYRAGVEKNLIDIENKRSDILMGKIYRAVREVAREHGVSVVVDKGQILFGRDSVDLTDKVILKLEEWPL